jgi:hypothetical protein
MALEEMRNGFVLDRSRSLVAFLDDIIFELLVYRKIFESMLRLEDRYFFSDHSFIDELGYVAEGFLMSTAATATITRESATARATLVATARAAFVTTTME